MHSRWIAAGVVAWGCWAPVVSAQDLSPPPAPAAPPTQATPPAAAKDVVRLKNGGLLRGTISEFMPGEKVVIVTVAGDVREFPMAEVDYAGPIAGESKPAPTPSNNEPAPESTDQGGETVRPYATVNGPTAQLQLESEPAGMTFYRQAAAAGLVSGYERLCTAPCNITLPAGTESFALGQKDEAFPREAEAVTIPAGRSRLVGSFKSRAGFRTAGWVVLGGSLVVGTIMIVVSMSGEKQRCLYDDYCYDEMDLSYPLLIAGSTLAIGGGLAGGWMAATPNSARVEVVPENSLPEKRRWASPGIVLKHKF